MPWFKQVLRDDGVHAVAQASQRAPRRFFVKYSLVAEVAAHAAPLFGDVGAQQARRAGLAPQLVAHVAVLPRLGIGGFHVFFDEAHHGVAVLLDAMSGSFQERGKAIGMVVKG